MSRGNPVADRDVRPLRPFALFFAVVDDARNDRARARGEAALLAAPGSDAAKVGDARDRVWRAQHPGFAELLDLMDGVR